MFHDNKFVTVASVDCQVHQSVCKDKQIRGYPSIRVYKSNSHANDFELVFFNLFP